MMKSLKIVNLLEWMLILQKHRKLDSNDSEGYLNICYHQHTLEKAKNVVYLILLVANIHDKCLAIIM